MNELISIVVPVYNAEKYIRETIATVQNQTYKEWELLLVDDASKDNSVEVMKEYELVDSRIRVISQKYNVGPWSVRNEGVDQSKGRYLAFLDSDDIWETEKLSKTLEFLKKEDKEFVFTAYEYANEEGVGSGKIANVPYRLPYKEALKNTIIFTSTVMIDMEKIEKTKIHMKNIASEDTATWWYILKQGHIAYGLDEVLVKYRRSKQSLSSNKLKAIKRIWYLYREEEKLSILYSSYNFMFYAIRTILRRL